MSRVGFEPTTPVFKRATVIAKVALPVTYVGALISLWLFLFTAQPKEFFLDVLKKLEQRSHKCVELRGEYVE
jgi:hypothetical protein